jgi:glycosyltransferase involved in cell wall biosynthesis
LKRRTGLPWVADFRDPWISDGTDRKLTWTQRWTRRWERSVFDHADLILANAPNACRLYQETYPPAANKIVTLTNGFDGRTDCQSVQVVPGRIDNPSYGQAPVRLLHAGEIYAGRDPLPLFEALAQLNAEPDSYHLQILGRNDTDLDKLLRERGWCDFVCLQGQRSYQESLDEMSRADILVLFDSPGRKIGVPAKLYEYLGAGRPILGLCEPDGDTAAILRQSGVLHRIASPKDVVQIRQALRDLAAAMRTTEAIANPALLERFTRANLTRTLAQRFDGLVGETSSPVDAVENSASLQEAES